MSGASFRVAAPLWRLCIVTLLLALLCGCAPVVPSAATPPEDEMPPMPELVLSRGANALAVELVDAACLQNVFKLTYENITDVYGVLLDSFNQLVVYVPGPDGNDALFLGVLPDGDCAYAAQEELDILFGLLCESNPDLYAPEVVTRGRYILYVCAADPAPAFAMFERALVWRA